MKNHHGRTEGMKAQLRKLIEESENIVFLGGAGVSTESNIPDFRSENGIYNQKYDYPPEYMLSHDFFIEHTEEFFDFYKNKMIFKDAKPNRAHVALAELEKRGKLKAIITQNIDGLHQMAGSKNVLELHGSVNRNYCTKCGKLYDLDFIMKSEGVPHCTCKGTVRPDVVLYDEMLDPMLLLEAKQRVENCDLLIVGGTSLTVYPAAGMVSYCHSKIVIINRAPTDFDRDADLCINGSIGEYLGDAIL